MFQGLPRRPRSCCDHPPTSAGGKRSGKRHGRTSPGTSNSGTIGDGFTRHWATDLHAKLTPNTKKQPSPPDNSGSHAPVRKTRGPSDAYDRTRPGCQAGAARLRQPVARPAKRTGEPVPGPPTRAASALASTANSPKPSPAPAEPQVVLGGLAGLIRRPVRQPGQRLLGDRTHHRADPGHRRRGRPPPPRPIAPELSVLRENLTTASARRHQRPPRRHNQRSAVTGS